MSVEREESLAELRRGTFKVLKVARSNEDEDKGGGSEETSSKKAQKKHDFEISWDEFDPTTALSPSEWPGPFNRRPVLDTATLVVLSETVEHFNET
jgi:hypothetical protein